MTVYRVVRASDTVIADTDGQVSTYDDADDRWEPREPTGGGGIRNVSGAVTLDATPGLVEVYATAAATVEGISLVAGDAAVFRYLAGEWTYMVVGTHTTWQSISSAPVTAGAPTWTDDTENGGGSWATPTITGITYSPASGTATPGQSVTVTATAQPGYTLTGTSSWTHTFPTAPGDTTDPTPGTIIESNVTATEFTLTITGASDAGGLATAPYAFSADNGATWTAYQSSNVLVVTGLTPETAYQVKGRVRDAAGNTADTPAKTVTTTAAPVLSYEDEVLADSPLHFLPLDDETGATSARNLGTAGTAWTPSGGVTFGATAIGSLTRSATFTNTTGSKITGPAKVLEGQTSWTVVALIIRGASVARQGVVGSSRTGGWGIVLNDAAVYGYKDSVFAGANPQGVQVPGGTPYLIAFTYDGSSLKGYLNGVVNGTGTAVTGATVEPNAVTIGAVGSDPSMAGQIAGVAIFPGKVLTAARLAAYAEAAGVA